MVRDAVQRKIEKGYGKPPARFWLLVHCQHTGGEVDDILAARRLLTSLSHPYDQAWFFKLLPNDDYDALIKLYPAGTSELAPTPRQSDGIAVVELPLSEVRIERR